MEPARGIPHMYTCKRGILWLASLLGIGYVAGGPMYGTDGENRGRIGVNRWRIGVCHLPIDH